MALATRAWLLPVVLPGEFGSIFTKYLSKALPTTKNNNCSPVNAHLLILGGCFFFHPQKQLQPHAHYDDLTLSWVKWWIGSYCSQGASASPSSPTASSSSQCPLRGSFAWKYPRSKGSTCPLPHTPHADALKRYRSQAKSFSYLTSGEFSGRSHHPPFSQRQQQVPSIPCFPSLPLENTG